MKTDIEICSICEAKIYASLIDWHKAHCAEKKVAELAYADFFEIEKRRRTGLFVVGLIWKKFVNCQKSEPQQA